MTRTIHELKQGSQEWLDYRATKLSASDCSAMLGISSYKTRAELIRQMATGYVAEVNEATQRLFAKGHEYEEIAREWAMEIIESDLFPVVMSCDDFGGLPLSASVDGIDLNDETVWEHKSLNQSLIASLDAGVIPDEYHPQMEQCLMVTGATRCLFMISSGNRDEMRHAWYESNPALRVRIIAGWKQLVEDVKNYQHIEVAPVVVASPMESLPLVSVQVTGQLAIISNLDIFGDKLKTFITKVPKKPSTDQEFADTEAAIKTMEKAEAALKKADEDIANGSTSAADLRATIATLTKLARDNRLAWEKDVKARKESIRVEIASEARAEFDIYVANLDMRIGANWMPTITTDFAGAMKGKKTVQSCRDAISQALADAKLKANAIADVIEINNKAFHAINKERDVMFLFRDLTQLIQKPAEDFIATVKVRIAEHDEKEAKRLEAEREKIRAEEEKKAREKAEREWREQEDAKTRAQMIKDAEQQAKEAATISAPPAMFGVSRAVTEAPRQQEINAEARAKVDSIPAGLEGEAVKLSGSTTVIQTRPQFSSLMESLNFELIKLNDAQLQRVLDFVRTVRVAA